MYNFLYILLHLFTSLPVLGYSLPEGQLLLSVNTCEHVVFIVINFSFLPKYSIMCLYVITQEYLHYLYYLDWELFNYWLTINSFENICIIYIIYNINYFTICLLLLQLKIFVFSYFVYVKNCLITWPVFFWLVIFV